MLIWTNFDKLCYCISNISRFLQKFHFPVEIVLNSLQTKKPGTSFQTAIFAEFFDEIISFEI